MRLAIALLVVASTLAGCTYKYDLAGPAWKKPNAMIQETSYDEMECVRSIREAGRTPDLIVGGLADLARYIVEEQSRASSFKSCMLGKGYQPSS